LCPDIYGAFGTDTVFVILVAMVLTLARLGLLPGVVLMTANFLVDLFLRSTSRVVRGFGCRRHRRRAGAGIVELSDRARWAKDSERRPARKLTRASVPTQPNLQFREPHAPALVQTDQEREGL